MAKISVVILADIDDHASMGRVTNALELVKEAKEAGDDVELVFDGAGAVAAVAIADSDHDLHRLYSLVEDKVSGVCRFCARAFHVYDQAEELGLPFLAEYDQHPSLRSRIADGYDVVTF